MGLGLGETTNGVNLGGVLILILDLGLILVFLFTDFASKKGENKTKNKNKIKIGRDHPMFWSGPRKVIYSRSSVM